MGHAGLLGRVDRDRLVVDLYFPYYIHKCICSVLLPLLVHNGVVIGTHQLVVRSVMGQPLRLLDVCISQGMLDLGWCVGVWLGAGPVTK